MVFSKSDWTGVGYIFWPKKILKKPKFPKYAWDLVGACRMLKSEKCPIIPASPPTPPITAAWGINETCPVTVEILFEQKSAIFDDICS